MLSQRSSSAIRTSRTVGEGRVHRGGRWLGHNRSGYAAVDMDLSALLPKVLQAVYETANGEVLASVDLESIAALLGASAKDVDSAVE